MGLAGSVLASTAQKMQEQSHSMRQTAEEMARMMQSLPWRLWQQLQQMREEPKLP
jgi:thiamine kinase-like enzyme